MINRFSPPQGEFVLDRFPPAQADNLRAWDAADELILQHLSGLELPDPPRTLVINDSFGALGVALNQWQPQSLSDSVLTWRASEANLDANGLPRERITLLTSLDAPRGPLDLVLIKIPKTLALLEDQLCRLRPLLSDSTRVIGAAMVKHLPPSAMALFERLIGPTTSSLAHKKARLLFATPDLSRPAPRSPYPSRYRLEGSGHLLINHANVFSREKLDIGTRLFLQHLPRNPAFRDILDLGCGNGVVGLMAAEGNPGAQLHFVDESFMALASARANFEAAFGDTRTATFLADNCLDRTPPGSMDLILNNPPFHQQQVVGDFIAWQMFRDALRCLRPQGELWVIGNRHLNYHVKLKKLFGHCETVASNRKFVVLRARKR